MFSLCLLITLGRLTISSDVVALFKRRLHPSASAFVADLDAI